MNATVPTRIEIDDRIRERPDLLIAVTQATDYLTEQAVDVPPPATICWRYGDADGKLLQLTLSDAADYPQQITRQDYKTSWIQDSVNQRLCVLKSWSELLDRRLDQHAARVNALLTELEREEMAEHEQLERKESNGSQVALGTDSGIATRSDSDSLQTHSD